MKRFLVVLFALGLIVAFSAPAAATDVKFSGSYYVVGYYDDNHDLMNEPAVGNGGSSAFYAQRLRVNTVFQVAEGLKLVTRFDAMEKVWGDATFIGTNANSANISWERCYVNFAIPTGSISVGYMQGGTWGTVFADSAGSVPRIKYVGVFGKWILLALTEKGVEQDIGTNTSDSDYDKYAVAFIKKFDGGAFGVLNFYLPRRTGSDTGNPATSFNQWRNYLAPYFKWKIGNIYLEGEASWFFGDLQDFDADGVTDVDLEGYNAYLFANVDLGQFYVGGQFAYVSGDDPNTLDENEGGYPSGEDWDPCLILFNDNLSKWMGNLGGLTGDQVLGFAGGGGAFIYQAFAGMKPMDKLNIKASFTTANADEKPAGYVDEDYGNEFDITATYKIYDNLTYMVGFGYLWTGDYYKAGNALAELDDNYLLVNKLTLKF